MTYLLENVGFRWTLRIWSAMLLFFGGLAVLGTKPRLPVAPASRNSPEFSLNLKFLISPLFIAVVSWSRFSATLINTVVGELMFPL